MESGLIKLFQVLCETASFAACRAYGTAESSFAKHQMLKAAAGTFFSLHDDDDNKKRVNEILKAYDAMFPYRNNIAHGIAVGYHLDDGRHSGYFLCPPSYASKKLKEIQTNVVYLLGAKYFFLPIEIELYAKRFEEILKEIMETVISILDIHRVLKLGQLHP